MIIENPSVSTAYFDVRNKQLHQGWKHLTKQISFDIDSIRNHVANCNQNAFTPDRYQPVIPNIYPIPPKSSWEFTGKFSQLNVTREFKANKTHTLETICRDLHRICQKLSSPIAVELSGGLDTSIIIGLLRKIGIDPTLIGAVSSRYEFRTERWIQNRLILNNTKSHLINEDECLPFSNLRDVPAHLIPNKASLFFNPNLATKKITESLKLKILFNGIGMDSLLTSSLPTNIFPQSFNKVSMIDQWANENIFRPAGTEYLSFAGLTHIKRAVASLRHGQPEDSKKLWARNFFIAVIPEELVRFSYKASFGGINFRGLTDNRDELFELCDEAYRLTKLTSITPSNIETLLDRTLDCDQEAEKELLSVLSYAVWVGSLNKEGLI